MKNLLIACILALLAAVPALAQTNPAWTTTTTAAITASQTTVPLTAVTNSTQSALGAVTPLAAGMGLYINGEYMIVAGSYVSGLQVPVLRGQLGTTAKPMPTSSTVIIAPATVYSTTDPGAGSSACPSTPAAYLIQVNVVTGNVWLCRYISGVREWTATNSRLLTYNSLTVR